MQARRRFRYAFDVVPLTCATMYLLYRFWLKHTVLGEIPFFPDHFNDVLCMPIFLPPVLWVQRQVGLRDHDGPPTALDVLFHLVVWSICFEGVAPLLTSIYRTTGDPWDVAAYAVGGLAAGLIWGTWRADGRRNRYTATHVRRRLIIPAGVCDEGTPAVGAGPGCGAGVSAPPL